MATAMDAIVYRRFSKDEQEEGDSLVRQSRACEGFAQHAELSRAP